MVEILGLDDEEERDFSPPFDALELCTQTSTTNDVQVYQPLKCYLTTFIKADQEEVKKSFDRMYQLFEKEDDVRDKKTLGLYERLQHIAGNNFTNGVEEYKLIVDYFSMLVLTDMIVEKKNARVLAYMMTQACVYEDLQIPFHVETIGLLKKEVLAKSNVALITYCLCVVQKKIKVDVVLILTTIKYNTDFITNAVVAGVLTYLRRKRLMMTSDAIEEFWKKYSVLVTTEELPRPVAMVQINQFPAHVTIDTSGGAPSTEIVIDDSPTRKSPVSGCPISSRDGAPADAQEQVPPVISPSHAPIEASDAREVAINDIKLTKDVCEISHSRVENNKEEEPELSPPPKRKKKEKKIFQFDEIRACVENFFEQWRKQYNICGYDYDYYADKEMRAQDVLNMYKEFAQLKKQRDDYFLSAAESTETKLQMLEAILQKLENKYVHVEEKRLIRRNVVFHVYFTM